MERNCQKRRQPPISDSIMATLMGFDELPHQQHLHKYPRVLSDSYISKSASLGLRQGSSVFIGRSRDRNSEMVQGVKGGSGIQIHKGKNHFVPDKHIHESSSMVKLVINKQKPAVVSLSKLTSGVCHEEWNALRYLQRLDNDSSPDQFHINGTGYTNDCLMIRSDMTDKPCISSTHVSNFKPMVGKAANYCGVMELDLLSRSGNGNIELPRRRFIEPSRTMNRTYRQQRHQSNQNKSQDSSGPSSKGNKYLTNESQALLAPRLAVYCYEKYCNGPHLSLYEPSLGQETLKKTFERRKIEKEIEKIEVSERGQTHVERQAFGKMESTPKYLNLRLGRNGVFTQSFRQSRNLGSISPLSIGRIKIWENEHVGNPHGSQSETIKESFSTKNGGKMEELEISRNGCESVFEQLSSPYMNCSMSQSAKSAELSSCYLSREGSEDNSPGAYQKIIQEEMEDSTENDSCRETELDPGVSKSSNLLFQCRIFDALPDLEASSGGYFSKISETEDQKPEPNSGFCQVKDASSSCSLEAPSGDASSNEFSDEESGYSDFFRLDTREVQTQLEGPIGQCSPDSVLESLHAMHPATLECFETIGPQSHFQVFNSEPEEEYSEGSEMVVSGSEEDKEEGIADLSYNSGKVHRWLGDDESRNFCYIVDVLDGAGCVKERSITDIIKSWDCLERPIDPLVFDALEKKYGKQACWQKSDRQLLFDLINSGLAIILKQLLAFQTHATPSLRIAGMKRNEVEDMLWKMVISLESEKSRNASEQVVEGAMKWWEVDNKDINVICRELEMSLFEELVMESISLWLE
ncbi:hypothetical protein F511_11272 [Dorcoceras hygrometricum]|uniref:DUF4378 domain-containing protein n=1 Tax=Dorcoceras hygrometricum TaxID=472368 RepID=A0A2Z7AT85_9LAMI|nr:hypothetical protein F511_11272 [Dorcoceras hygrometricum]